MNDNYSAASGQGIYAGRFAPEQLLNPNSVSFTWPPTTQCDIPVSEGVNSPVHPSVIDFGSQWNGYRYWMAFTPYPDNGSSDLYEQPCVVASNDATNWIAPAPNPIVPAPEGVQTSVLYNSDTHIVFVSGTLYMIWRLFDSKFQNRAEILKFVSTTDGINWSAQQEMNLSAFGGTASKLLSPAVEYDDGLYKCWTVRVTVTPSVVELRTASSLSGTWSAPTICSLTIPDATREVWHIDVKKVSGGWVMLICDRLRGGTNFRLWLASSPDGINWTVGDSAFGTSPTAYRSCLWNYTDRIECWVTDWVIRKIKRLTLTKV